mmetsp:Transcript_31831/g.38507  ORF Transcript_31831/g.38507 Transcript_31831/m.38507 type:complete len:348 (-) Transcript_31831:501-1544(-)|eukprot:CAMPEP_0197848512 /NCGR_PEP_ID=MMETSP1438-20131217/8963_1 /TAXON_ID=1461541 /ORGANISM="Pterosperma sp., Strain CCMP1384" /LENGTH=347 /DNA_ID=CAMNT_0043460795 /DNA_START=76 /DNA_END=1119 /DNA_ORIENTATION=+
MGDDVFDLIAEAEEREATARTFFQKHDADASGEMDRDELPYALAELGLLDGLEDSGIDAFLEDQFTKLDQDGNGKISFSEFIDLYNAAIREKEWVTSIDCWELKEMYHSLCSFKTFKRRDGLDIDKGDWLKATMTTEVWLKMAKDAKLMNKDITKGKLEKIYKSVQPRGEKALKYRQFMCGLSILAEKSGRNVKDLVIHLLSLAKLTSEELGEKKTAEKKEYKGKFKPSNSRQSGISLNEQMLTGLRFLFEKFCVGLAENPNGLKSDEMEEFKFMKFCRDTSIYDDRFTEKTAKWVFKEATPGDQKRMNFMNFRKSMTLIAAEKGQKEEELMHYLSLLKGITPSADE